MDGEATKGIGRWSALAVIAALAVGTGASAQIASTILREGDALPGGAGEIVESVNNTAVNHVGGYAVSLSATGAGAPRSHVWGSEVGGAGRVLRTESTLGQLEQTSFESFFGMSDSGQICYSAGTTDLVSGTTGLDSMWLDDTLILIERSPVAAFPGLFSSFNNRPSITADGVPIWVAGLTDVPGGVAISRSLCRGATVIPILAAGDPVGGVPESVGPHGIDFDYRVSALGTNVIQEVRLDAPAEYAGLVTFNGNAIVAGSARLRQGTAVPALIGGLPPERWDSFDFLGVTEAPRYMVTGDTDGDSATDEFVMMDGRIVLREGDVVARGADRRPVTGAIEGGYLNEDGDWAVGWNVDVDGTNAEALIVNCELVLTAGDLVDWNGDGTIDEADEGATLFGFTGITSMTLGDREPGGTVCVYFTAEVDIKDHQAEAFFRLRCTPAECSIPCPADVDDSGAIGFADLTAILSAWGACPGCPEDINNDKTVGFPDLIELLATWGPCP